MDMRSKRTALREDQEHYCSLFDNMLSGLAYCKMTFDKDVPIDFTYLEVNGAFERLTGLKNVVGKRVSEVIPGLRESNPEFFEIYGRVALTGKPERFEAWVEPLGEWFSISVYSPKKGHFVALFDVITERKRAERALKESEERYRVAVESSNDGVALLRGDTHIFVNQRFLDMSGYNAAEEVVGKPLSMTVHPDDREMIARYTLMRERGEPVPSRYEIRGITKNGVTKYIEASVARVTYLGEPASLAYLRDVTDRKRTEEALKESESCFKGAFEASGIGMALVALDGCWLKVNQSLCDMLGYSEQELLTKTFQDITHPGDLENDLEYIEKLMDDQIPYYRLEKRYYHRDGYIVWAALSVSLARDARGYPLYFVGQIEDITERKLLEEKLQTIAVTDELTRLYNRKGFFERASEQLRIAQKTKERHVLFFADLDHMKSINDTLGHREGDVTLAEVARLLKDTFRESDIIGRIGGDEFAILAVGTTEAEQEVLLTRLQHNVDKFNIDHTSTPPISISIGFGRYEPENPRQLEALLTEADVSMYEKKRMRKSIRG